MTIQSLSSKICAMTLREIRPGEIPQGNIIQEVERFIKSPEFLQHAREPNTRSAYTKDMRKFGTYCQDSGIGSLSSLNLGHIEMWPRKMKVDGYSFATIQRRKSSLAGFLDWARENGLLSRKLSDFLAPAYEERLGRSRKGLNQEELSALLRVAKRRTNYRDAAFIQIAVQTGQKLNKIVDLNRRDVIEKDGQMEIRFFDKKKDEYETVRVDKESADIIDGYLAEKHAEPEDPLFTGRNNDRLTRAGSWLSLKKYRSRINVPNLNPHAS